MGPSACEETFVVFGCCMHPESMRADAVTISICATRMIVLVGSPHHGVV
ncbi:hypothetical protein SynPROS91_00861 [Synechococcus sp. PROS-9-1]|nr:hypothetical protein SynPROS91_00861 [Synechococcus sp. PROS-9-1]